MAELHDLSPTTGSTKNRKRKGRGPGSGNGKTAGRGQKGQNSRSGGRVHPRFEGGQMALMRRIPKRGFKSRNRIEYQVVNVRDLERVDGEVTPESLRDAGLISSLRQPVKILGEGELSAKVTVSAHKFSASAVSKIEGAGGSVTVIGATAVVVEEDAPAAEPDAPAEEPAAEETPEAEAEAAPKAEAEAGEEPAAEADEAPEADAAEEEESKEE